MSGIVDDESVDAGAIQILESSPKGFGHRTGEPAATKFIRCCGRLGDNPKCAIRRKRPSQYSFTVAIAWRRIQDLDAPTASSCENPAHLSIAWLAMRVGHPVRQTELNGSQTQNCGQC